MKKIILVLIVLATSGFVFAQTVQVQNCKIVDQILSYDMHNILDSFEGTRCDWVAKEQILKEKIQKLNTVLKMVQDKKIAESGTSASCQKISQTLWEGKAMSSYQSNDDILLLHKFLQNEFQKSNLGREIGLYLEPGVFDTQTTLQIKAFQKKYGIKQTGAVGPQTLTKINSMICGWQTSVGNDVTLVGTYKYANSGYSVNQFEFTNGPDGKPAVIYFSGGKGQNELDVNGNVAFQKAKMDVLSYAEALAYSSTKYCWIEKGNVQVSFRNLVQTGNDDGQGRRMWTGKYVTAKSLGGSEFTDVCVDANTQQILSKTTRNQ